MRHHKGEICFPGGMFDEEMGSGKDALRKASEEIRLKEDTVHVLGVLDDT